jgi:ribosomal protein S18 acetylase RimI-like enzyme
MSLLVLDKTDIAKQKDLSFFIDVIYNNFIELSREDKLMHTKQKIEENLKSDNSIIILMLNNDKKIIGFITANIIMLDDRRKVFFVTYIYVAETERNRKIGSELLNKAEGVGKQNNCLGIMLIFDTHQQNLVRFYEDRGYMLDINLRRYEIHDVFYKIL